MATSRETWREFWNRENSIYVNDRHRALHDDLVARGIVSLIEAPNAVALDYGCGEATSASLVAARCDRLYLYDSAPSVRERLRQRTPGDGKIAIVEDEGLGDIPDGSLDFIVVNSVLQYVPKRDFEALLDRFGAKLKPAGLLALADVIPAGAGSWADIKSLLTFGFEGGFLVAALAGLATTFFSDYRKLRVAYGLTRYDDAEMISLLAAHGLSASRAARNLGHNQARMMFLARPAPAST